MRTNRASLRPAGGTKWDATDPEPMTAAYKQLALEALRVAIEDAKGTGERARAARVWLARDALTWFELAGVGVQPGKFRAWLAGLPQLASPPAWRGTLISLLFWECKAYGYGHNSPD